MREEGCIYVFAVLVLVVLGLAITYEEGWKRGSKYGHEKAKEMEESKAIKAGVGRWEIDPATGKKSFIYGDKK